MYVSGAVECPHPIRTPPSPRGALRFSCSPACLLPTVPSPNPLLSLTTSPHSTPVWGAHPPPHREGVLSHHLPRPTAHSHTPPFPPSLQARTPLPATFPLYPRPDCHMSCPAVSLPPALLRPTPTPGPPAHTCRARCRHHPKLLLSPCLSGQLLSRARFPPGQHVPLLPGLQPHTTGPSSHLPARGPPPPPLHGVVLLRSLTRVGWPPTTATNTFIPHCQPPPRRRRGRSGSLLRWFEAPVCPPVLLSTGDPALSEGTACDTAAAAVAVGRSSAAGESKHRRGRLLVATASAGRGAAPATRVWG